MIFPCVESIRFDIFSSSCFYHSLSFDQSFTCRHSLVQYSLHQLYSIILVWLTRICLSWPRLFFLFNIFLHQSTLPPALVPFSRTNFFTDACWLMYKSILIAVCFILVHIVDFKLKVLRYKTVSQFQDFSEWYLWAKDTLGWAVLLFYGRKKFKVYSLLK